MIDTDEWYDKYCRSLSVCSACTARKDCKWPVPGEGNSEAKVILLGRNPGRTEDEEGRPFVGAAGKILDVFIEKELGLQRGDIFITNIVLCHTKGNRSVSKKEAVVCISRFLIPTLEFIKPKIMVVFGKQPNYFVNGILEVKKYNGRVFQHKRGFKTVVSIHPASILYHRNDWHYLQEVGRVVRGLLGDN